MVAMNGRSSDNASCTGPIGDIGQQPTAIAARKREAPLNTAPHATFDTGSGIRPHAVLQGDVCVRNEPGIVLSTILGSCVAACMWDPVAGVGGLNHFLLPGGEAESDAIGYGVHAMELLVNGLIQNGAMRNRIKVKLFGGAKMYSGGIDIGKKNTEFALWFVENEGFDLTGSCLGGTRGRALRFWPVEGRVQRRFMDDPAIATQEAQPQGRQHRQTDRSTLGGDVQLF